jgi:hypothetical protein
VIVEQIAEKYFTLWHRLNSIDAPKKVWKSLRRLAESQPVEGGLGLSESFWGYKEITAQVTIENIPKDDAHAPDRLMLRTSSGRGGLKSSSKSIQQHSFDKCRETLQQSNNHTVRSGLHGHFLRFKDRQHGSLAQIRARRKDQCQQKR